MTRTGSVPAAGAVLDENFNGATLPRLRAQVAACAAAAGLPGSRADEITIAVHELAANAVVHGPGTGRLLVHAAPGELRCQVSDTGPGPDEWPLQPGHGLWIVHKVATRVTMSSGPEGATVIAVFETAPPPQA